MLEQKQRTFLLRRLHALTGILPVGVFLVMHLWTNAKATLGRRCFAQAVDEIQALPFLPLIEVLFIFLPLAFHATYGVKLAFEAKNNVHRYGYGQNWMFVVQRATGLVALTFILVHLWDFRVAKALGTLRMSDLFDQVSVGLAIKWRALLYLLGTTACIVHFVNGLRTVAFSWGVTQSANAQRRFTRLCVAFGGVLWLIAANTVVFFSTGDGMVPSRLLRGGKSDVCESGHNVLIQ